MLEFIEWKQDILRYLKRHQGIKFKKLTPTLLIQNYLFMYWKNNQPTTTNKKET